MTVYKNDYDIKNYKKTEDPFVQYLIVRKSLNMGTGKIAAQCAHGTQLILSKIYEWDQDQNCLSIPHNMYNIISRYNNWCDNFFPKIVKVADDKEWEKIKEQVDCMVVIDLGLTEIEKGSETVIATFPDLKSNTHKIIKRLQLLNDRT